VENDDQQTIEKQISMLKLKLLSKNKNNSKIDKVRQLQLQQSSVSEETNKSEKIENFDQELH
jgi:hypothetical protein